MFNIGKKEKRKAQTDPILAEEEAISADNVLDQKETSEDEEATEDEEKEAEEAEEAAPDPESETDPGAEEIEEEVADDAMMAAFEAFLEDSIPDEGRRAAAMAAMDHVRDSLRNGMFDEAIFDIITKGTEYDSAVEEAELAGELRGRNARIDELMADGPLDDGIPHPGANGGNNPHRSMTIFDLAKL